jgi:hypothetical protein
MIKRPISFIVIVEGGTKAWIKGIENLFCEIITEKIPNLEKNMNIYVQESL